MGTRLTIYQIEQMKTHEMADLLANVVLLLRRLPDIEYKYLIEQVSSNKKAELSGINQTLIPEAFFIREDLAKKKVAELKTLARELNIFFPATIKKEDLIAKLLTRPTDGHSEQKAIQDM